METSNNIGKASGVVVTASMKRWLSPAKCHVMQLLFVRTMILTMMLVAPWRADDEDMMMVMMMMMVMTMMMKIMMLMMLVMVWKMAMTMMMMMMIT